MSATWHRGAGVWHSGLAVCASEKRRARAITAGHRWSASSTILASAACGAVGRRQIAVCPKVARIARAGVVAERSLCVVACPHAGTLHAGVGHAKIGAVVNVLALSAVVTRRAAASVPVEWHRRAADGRDAGADAVRSATRIVQALVNRHVTVHTRQAQRTRAVVGRLHMKGIGAVSAVLAGIARRGAVVHVVHTRR